MPTIPARSESDSFGALDIPEGKYFGAQTARSIMNFPIGGETQPLPLIHALGIVKQAAARVNNKMGKLDDERAKAIEQAANEVATGALDAHFPLLSGKQVLVHSLT